MAEGFLRVCCVCESIRLSKNPEVWLSKEQDEKKYNSLTEQYKGKFSHTYCSPCLKEAKEEVRNSKTPSN